MHILSGGFMSVLLIRSLTPTRPIHMVIVTGDSRHTDKWIIWTWKILVNNRYCGPGGRSSAAIFWFLARYDILWAWVIGYHGSYHVLTASYGLSHRWLRVTDDPSTGWATWRLISYGLSHRRMTRVQIRHVIGGYFFIYVQNLFKDIIKFRLYFIQ